MNVKITAHFCVVRLSQIAEIKREILALGASIVEAETADVILLQMSGDIAHQMMFLADLLKRQKPVVLYTLPGEQPSVIHGVLNNATPRQLFETAERIVQARINSAVVKRLSKIDETDQAPVLALQV